MKVGGIESDRRVEALRQRPLHLRQRLPDSAITVSRIGVWRGVMPRNTAFKPSKAEVEWSPADPGRHRPSRQAEPSDRRDAARSLAKCAGLSSEVWALMFCWMKSPFTSPAAVVKLFMASAPADVKRRDVERGHLLRIEPDPLVNVEPPRISAPATPLIACRLRLHDPTG